MLQGQIISPLCSAINAAAPIVQLDRSTNSGVVGNRNSPLHVSDCKVSNLNPWSRTCGNVSIRAAEAPSLGVFIFLGREWLPFVRAVLPDASFEENGAVCAVDVVGAILNEELERGKNT